MQCVLCAKSCLDGRAHKSGSVIVKAIEVAMSKLNLNLFETFVVVAQELHFGRAARRLHRSQPPISRQISQLEQDLGFELFVRNTQSVALSPAGQALFREIRPTLDAIEQAIQTARRVSKGQVGSLALGMTPSIMFGVLPTLLADYRQREPDVIVKLHMRPKAEQLHALKDNGLDIALVRSLSHDADLRYDLLLNEPLVVAMGPTNPLAAKTEIQLADLSEAGFILYRGQAALSVADQIVAACHTAGFSPRVVQETDDMQSAAALAALDVGITLIASSLQNLGLSGLVCRPIRVLQEPLTIPLYAVYRRTDNSVPVTTFLELARQTCRASSA